MSKPAPRPKRAAEQFARSHHGVGDNDSGAKKPRFDPRNPSTLIADADEEDAVLELDEIGKGGQQTKRNAVNLDGYDSDSSTENFDSRAEAKANQAATQSKDEEDNDMFADLEEKSVDGDEEETGDRLGKTRKKAVRFISDQDIEGQVANSKSGGHVSADFSVNARRGSGNDQEESSSDDSGDDEERARLDEGLDEELGAGAKKKKVPKLDAFNMRNEAEEGRFDESGNFVRNAADPYAVHDAWLEGSSSKADVRRAKEAEEKREEERRKRDIEDDKYSMGDDLQALIIRLEKGETVLEALARLGTGKTKKKPNWQKNKRKGDDAPEMDVDQTGELSGAERKRRENVEAITAAADRLLTRGQGDIYEAERELLVRQYRRETGEDWVEPARANEQADDAKAAAEVSRWEYRWSDARDGGETHGPYDGPTMIAWNEAGYFGEGVEFRRVGEQAWSRLAEFT